MVNRLPKAVIDDWKKVKHDLVPLIEKMKPKKPEHASMLESAKKELKKKIETLFDQFDRGLKDKLKKASETKDDAEAKTALKDVAKIAADYKAKTRSAESGWERDYPETGKKLAGRITKSLDDIEDASKRTLKALGG